MKKLLFSLAIMVFAVAYLTGCKQDPSSSTMSMKAPPPPANAHPAWTHPSSKIINKTNYYTIAVCDSDATNSANVYTAPSSTVVDKVPTWSSDGKSVSFIEKPGSGTGTNYIKAIDVSVVNGVATGSNSRTIYTTTTDNISYQAWCQDATTAKIAFVSKNSSGTYSVKTISTSGGTANTVYTAAGTDIIGDVTWSNDGTELAITYKTGSTLEIKVIDASTGTENATLVSGSGYINISKVEWSHSGQNTLEFSATTKTGGSTADYSIYTIPPTAGSTETKVITGYNGSWSPDNSEIVYTDDSTPPAVNRKVTVGTGATSGTIGTSSIDWLDWKQP